MIAVKTDVTAVHNSVNWERFKAYTMGDRQLQIDVIQIFRAQTREYISDLRYAKDKKAWKMAAHTLKGTALTMGADNLAKLASEAEEMDIIIENRYNDDLRENRVDLRALLKDIETELNCVNLRLAEII